MNITTEGHDSVSVPEVEADRPTQEGEVSLTTPETSPKLRVLIADDAIAVQQSLVRLLNDIEDVEVAGLAQDVAGALQAIQALKPEVVILDLRMPGGSGLDVLETLRHESEAPKVIVLTNYAFTQYRKKCLEAGASFFFDKSTEFDQLPQALEELRPAGVSPSR
jgi:DNA-binding NarL/FixJ family response regulator